jgi:uncharacterized membrane protein
MLAHLLPILLALGTALSFSVSALFVRIGVERARPVDALFVTLTVNIIVLWAIAFWNYDPAVTLWEWRYFIVAGVFAPGLGRLCSYIGIQRLGVNLSVPISNANPLVSVAIAIAILGESVSLIGSVGGLLAIAGGIFLSSVRSGGTKSFDTRYLVFPVLAAVLYGVVQILRDVGLRHVPTPVVGAAVNMTTSWILIGIYLVATGQYRSLWIGTRELRYFVPAGISSSIGLLCLYSALRTGDVVIVTPILNTGPLFALALTYVFLRDDELFGRRVTIGTACIIFGFPLLTVARYLG